MKSLLALGTAILMASPANAAIVFQNSGVTDGISVTITPPILDPNRQYIAVLTLLDPLKNMGGEVYVYDTISYFYYDDYESYTEYMYGGTAFRLQASSYVYHAGGYTSSPSTCTSGCTLFTSQSLAFYLQPDSLDGEPLSDVRWQFTLSDVTASSGPAPVPEPSFWAMMIAGAAIAGGALRARRRPRVRVTFN